MMKKGTEKLVFMMSTKKALGRIPAGRKRKEKSPPVLNLVTGATGRLGRHLVRALLDMGEKVRVLVRQGEGAQVPEGTEAVYGNIVNRHILDAAVEDVDYVYHLAALLDRGASFEDLLEVNYRGTRNLLDACLERGYRVARFVYVSSTAVYGKELTRMPADEETETNPTDNYGKSKLLAEEAVMQYADKLPVVILRPAVIYGPGFNEGFHAVLGALEKGRMCIIGKGDNVIPLVHVRDVVRALILAAKSEKARGRVYNICSHENRTQRQLLEMASRLLGVPAPTKCRPKYLVKLQLRIDNLIARLTGRRPKMVEEYIDVLASNRLFDITRAKNELGFEPSVKLEEGMAEVVEEYRKLRGGSR